MIFTYIFSSLFVMMADHLEQSLLQLQKRQVCFNYTHTHTHTRLTALFPGLPR